MLSTLFNGTNRGFIIGNITITALCSIFVALVGPQHFEIPAINFHLCLPQPDGAPPAACTQHLTVYVFAFGLLMSFFLSAIFLTMCRGKQQQIDQSTYFRIAQVLLQIVAMYAVTFLKSKTYKVGYWMFFNCIKFFFLQAQYFLQRLRQIHHFALRTERNRLLLFIMSTNVVLYFVFIALNGMYFFAQCDNRYDILIVCTVTLNILGLLAAVLEKVHGFFLPICIATFSQGLLFFTLHLTPRAVSCSKSPFTGTTSTWVFTTLLVVSYLPLTVASLLEKTNPLTYFLTWRAKLLVAEGYEEILLPGHDNPQNHPTAVRSINFHQPLTPHKQLEVYDDPILLRYDWKLQHNLIQNDPSNPRADLLPHHRSGGSGGGGIGGGGNDLTTSLYPPDDYSNPYDTMGGDIEAFHITPSEQQQQQQLQQQQQTQMNNKDKKYNPASAEFAEQFFYTPQAVVSTKRQVHPDDIYNDPYAYPPAATTTAINKSQQTTNKAEAKTDRLSPAVNVYLYSLFMVSLLTFALTHFGEHQHYPHLGMYSNHVQWFFIMFGAWMYLLYAWHVVCRLLFPHWNLI